MLSIKEIKSMNKVVGILTFHRATNYGALLQAYALQQVIKELGHEVLIVDYRCGQVGKIFLSLRVSSFTRKLKRLAYNCYLLPQYPFLQKRRNIYTGFSDKYMNLSQKDFNLADERWSCFVMGSDQVWNIRLTNGFDKYFYGDFHVANGTRKIGYAVSASENLDQSMSNPQCQSALYNFDAIGCREAELLAIIKDKVSCPTALVLDPTLLGGKGVFNNLVTHKYKAVNPYILVYQMNTSKDTEIISLAHKIADNNGWDIMEIPSKLSYKKMLFKNEWHQWITPVEFVDLFRKAQFVITTSFHGVAFSLIYNKPFFLYSINKAIDARASYLLKSVNLLDRKIQKCEDVNVDDLFSINWEKTNEQLLKLRLESLNFLKNAL